ncbi:MAG: hypothetical protein ACOC3G_08375, partial [Phycisphaeraceae bacterium]
MALRTSAADAAPTELIVLSDDWGRHPSSCQHLVRELMAIHGDALSVTWVNTIGTRPMRWSAADLRRAAGKVREFAGGIRTFASLRTGLRGSSDGVKVAEPCVVSPVMWPGFRNRVQRWVNAASMARSI